MGRSVTEADDGYVQLSTGEKVSTRSLIWCVGVRADPLMDGLDLDTNRGQLVVDEVHGRAAAPGHLRVRGLRGGARPDPPARSAA